MILDIRDRPGVIPAAVMRAYFERAINETSALATNVALGHVVDKDSRFSEYRSSEAQAMWIGFAIGMRCAERLAADHEPVPAYTGTKCPACGDITAPSATDQGPVYDRSVVVRMAAQFGMVWPEKPAELTE